jgi:hypothetical protein
MQASAAHYATTRDGGEIKYQAVGIKLIDALAAFIVFFTVLCWGAVSNAMSNDNVVSVLPLPEPVRKQDATYGKIGWVWFCQYWKAVLWG